MGKNFDTDELPIGTIVGSAFGCGVGVALLWLWPLGPIAKKRVESGQVLLAPGISSKKASSGKDTDTDVASGHPAHPEESDENAVAAAKGDDLVGANDEDDDQEITKENKDSDKKDPAGQDGAAAAEARPSFSHSLRKLSQSFADNTYNQDLEGQSMAENAKAKQIWENAELYDEDAEMMFTYLQVFTASMNSFAHGGKI